MSLRDGRVKDWFYLENALVEREDINYQEKLIYMVIAKHVNEQTQQAFPSYNTIAKKAGISRSTTIRAVNELIKKGLLRKEIRKKKNQLENDSNLYTLLSAKTSNASYESVHPNIGGSVTDTPPSITHTPRGVTGTPEQYLYNNTNISINKNICENDVLDNQEREVFDYWNKLIKDIGLMKKGKKYTTDINKIIKARLKDHGLEDLKKMIYKLSQNAYYLGHNDNETVYFCKHKTVFNKAKCADRIENLEVSPVDTKPKSTSQNKNGFHNFKQKDIKYTNDELKKKLRVNKFNQVAIRK